MNKIQQLTKNQIADYHTYMDLTDQIRDIERDLAEIKTIPIKDLTFEEFMKRKMLDDFKAVKVNERQNYNKIKVVQTDNNSMIHKIGMVIRDEMAQDKDVKRQASLFITAVTSGRATKEELDRVEEEYLKAFNNAFEAVYGKYNDDIKEFLQTYESDPRNLKLAEAELKKRSPKPLTSHNIEGLASYERQKEEYHKNYQKRMPVVYDGLNYNG